VPWVVSYSREDIQDVRSEVREVRRSVQRLDEKLSSGLERLDEKIDSGLARLDARIKGLNRKMDVQLRWIIGIVSMAPMTSRVFSSGSWIGRRRRSGVCTRQLNTTILPIYQR